MDLRSSETIWKADPAAGTAGLADDISCDVVVIGSGISGALAAWHLLNAGVTSVVMLDRRGLSQGSIGASTALLLYELDTPLCHLVKQIGQAQARRVYQACYDAIGHFDRLIERIGNDCAYKRRKSLYLAGAKLNADQLAEEYADRTAMGLDLKYLSKPDLRDAYNIDRPAALLSADAAEVDPVRLTKLLIDQCVAMGLRLFCHTSVEKYLPRTSDVLLTTTAGRTVTAKNVIFATGYETEQFLGRQYVNLATTFAVVSHPVERFANWEDRCLIWEAADPYFYARTTSDNRIVIGGGDVPGVDPAVRQSLLPGKADELVRQFHELFPGIDFRPSGQWAGVFAETSDGLPCIGTHAGFPRGYFSLGYGGNGITFALIAARIIRDSLTNVPNTDADLFDFGRFDSAEAVDELASPTPITADWAADAGAKSAVGA